MELTWAWPSEEANEALNGSACADPPGFRGKVTFDALMTGDGKAVKLGKDAGKVTGELVETKKGEKVTVFKKRRRNTYRRKLGHRQAETTVKITAIG